MGAQMLMHATVTLGDPGGCGGLGGVSGGMGLYEHHESPHLTQADRGKKFRCHEGTELASVFCLASQNDTQPTELSYPGTVQWAEDTPQN